MTKFRRDDLTKAHRAIGICGKLTGDQMCVAAALIESFDVKSNRTTLSHGRLGDAVGLHEKTVRRAVVKLCGLGLFTRCSFGGGAQAAAYQPNWERFRAINRDWSARMRAADLEFGAADVKRKA